MPLMHKLAIVGFDRPANAKVKRARRGMEKNWNRFGDPLKKFLGGHWDSDSWHKYKRKKESYLKDES